MDIKAKLRPFYVAKLLYEQTDEEHYLTLAQIMEQLEKEYGISTFVYSSKKPFDVNKFEDFVNNRFPPSVIRCKGLVWFASNYDMSFLFEQAGRQMTLSETGYWLASAPKDELDMMISEDPSILKDWDDEVGDRTVKLVFIGKNMNKEAIIQELNNCID